MKIKDLLSKISQNQKNGQMTTCLRKGKLKEAGISPEDFMNLKINPRLKEVLFEED